jgi:ABC-type transport system substrate-binding protein
METGALVSTKMFTQTYDALLIGATWDTPEPQVLTNLFMNSTQDVVNAGFNFSSYNNPAVDALLAQTGSNVDCSADTRGPLWRRTIRYALARFKAFHLYYRSPDAVAAVLRDGGFVERERHLGHSFSVLGFERPEARGGGASTAR